MHTARDLVGLSELTAVYILWFDDWYDGPRSGLARYQDREFWFAAVELAADDDWRGPRRHILHVIDEDEAAAEWREHRSFVAEVGGACLHEPRCPERPLATVEEMRRWYERHPPESGPDYLSRPAVGWFGDESCSDDP